MASLGSLAAVALVSTISLTAEAGPAWTAAKANLPKETSVLVGLDLAQLQKSSLFSFGFPMMLSQQPDLKEGLELVKSTCKLDPMKIVKDVVIGADDNQKHGAIFLSVDGLDQAKLVACLEAVAAAKGKKDVKVAVKTDGKITEIAVGDKSVFLSWIGTNVIALPIEVSSKADLQAWTGAKALAKSKVAKGMGKVNTSAAAWAVSGMPKDLDDKTKMKMGYGSVTLSGGKLGADFHVQLASAESAKAAAEKAQKELTGLASSNGLDPSLKAVLLAVTVVAAGDELQIKGAMPESDVLQLVGALMR
jgi:hypothetical protein